MDGVVPSKTDAKRMIEAFIAVELAGGANDGARDHARAALKLAVALQHDRTADFRTAALCAEATASVVNIIGIIQAHERLSFANHAMPSEKRARSLPPDSRPEEVKRLYYHKKAQNSENRNDFIVFETTLLSPDT